MSEENQLLDTSRDELLCTVQDGDIANWEDSKKSDFVDLFHNRVRVARYILEKTAYRVAATAEKRQFISQKHLRKLYDSDDLRYGQGLQFNAYRFADPDKEGQKPRWNDPKTVGGREPSALDAIVELRAKAVLEELPPLKTAVQIIDPETAKLIERKEKLQEQGEKIREEVETVSEPILMADLDQKMTIGDFRKLVSDRDQKRKQLLSKLSEIGKEGSELEATIAKRLYAGLPGLSEAVVEVIKSHIDRSTALDEVSRRVEEQVKFGDSEAATSLLNHFEQDEAEIGDKVRSQLADAMEKLKLSVKGARKKVVKKKALKS
jgi:hypothetical protein